MIALLMPVMRSTKYPARCAFASQTGSRTSVSKPCSCRWRSASGTACGGRNKSRSLVLRQMPVCFCSANAPDTTYGTPARFSCCNTSQKSARCSGGRFGGTELLTGSSISVATAFGWMAQDAHNVVAVLKKRDAGRRGNGPSDNEIHFQEHGGLPHPPFARRAEGLPLYTACIPAALHGIIP